MSTQREMHLNDEQAEGRACIVCNTRGKAADNCAVGRCEDNVIWACYGGCVLQAGLKAL